MSNHKIVSEVVKIEKSNIKRATHFALYNGSQLRYLIDLNNGKTRLSLNISTYSKKLRLLMCFLNIMPLQVLKWLRLGYFANVALHEVVEECRKNTQKKYWNMMIGTYDKKQKLVIQCFNKDGMADYIKIGNATSEKEMNAEISFLQERNKYTSFDIPELAYCKRRVEGSEFNLQVTKEFLGDKVEPVLNEDIIAIYQEVSKDKKNNLEFSHGDFAPWNLKKHNGRYTLFDWEHCDYRMQGFDLMHFVTVTEIVLNGKSISNAYDRGMEEIRKYIPEFNMKKEEFLIEFQKLRIQITGRG